MKTATLGFVGGLGASKEGGFARIVADCRITWPRGQECDVQAMIDTGAGRSWIDEALAPKDTIPAAFDVPALAPFGEKSLHSGYWADLVISGQICVRTIMIAGPLVRTGVHAIIGLDVLSLGRLDIDYPSGRAVFIVSAPDDPEVVE